MASAAWEARNARARALGYESYYDYRAHDNGRLAPSEGRLRGDALARSRGHRGAADLERLLSRGQIELVMLVDVDRNALGQIIAVHVVTTDRDGHTTRWTLRGDDADPTRFAKRIADMGFPGAVRIIGSPKLRRSFQGAAGVEEEEEEYKQTELDDANYRPAELRHRRCSNCSFYEAQGQGVGFCDMFETEVEGDHVCDEWAPRRRRRRR